MDFLDSEYKTTGLSNEIRFCCPWCVDDGFHLYYNLTNHLYYCFRCGRKGKVRDLKTQPYIEKPKKKKFELKQEKFIDVIGDSFIQDLAIRYWHDRGLTDDELGVFNVKLNPERWSLVFPVCDEDGRHVFNIQRKIFNIGNPYYIDANAPKKEILYNFNQAKKYERIYIVEGVFDVFAIGKNAVALFGKFLSKEHLELLRRSSVQEIGIVLDKDAMTDAYGMFRTLEPRYRLRLYAVKPRGYKDIADFRQAEGHDAVLGWLDGNGSFPGQSMNIVIH